MKNLFRLAGIIAALVIHAAAANITTLGVNKPKDCPALAPLLEDLKAVQFPSNWTLYVACSDVAWQKIVQREDVQGLTNAGITDKVHHLTIINGAMYSSAFSFDHQVQRTPQRILKHELGHIACDSRREDVADRFVETGVCGRQVLLLATTEPTPKRERKQEDETALPGPSLASPSAFAAGGLPSSLLIPSWTSNPSNTRRFIDLP